MLLFPAPTKNVQGTNRSSLTVRSPQASLSEARPVQVARPPPGELALLDAAARGDPQAQKAEISPAFNTQHNQALPLLHLSVSSCKRRARDVLSAGTMRHHKVFVTKWDFSATPGVSLHNNTQHPESMSTLNTDALLLQWDQLKS